jgi:uncharacterized protein
MMAGEILLIILSFLLVLGGALGVILPFMPGVPMAWLGMLIFAYATNFVAITWKALLVFLGFVLLTIALDMIAPIVGAKKYNASRYGVIGSFIGVILGVAFLGPIGIVIGPLFGTFLGELFGGKESEETFQSAKGTAIGFLAGSAVKLALITVMLGFLIWSLF